MLRMAACGLSLIGMLYPTLGVTATGPDPFLDRDQALTTFPWGPLCDARAINDKSASVCRNGLRQGL
jgi:hypothetical protein